MHKTKINRGWWMYGDIHIVNTERYGGDRHLDWVAIEGEDEARRIWHGGALREILWVGNRLSDFNIGELDL